MRILFVHNNFPAQFGAFGQYLAKEGWHVTFMTQRPGAKAPGIDTVVYQDRPLKAEYKVRHPFLASTGKAVVTGTSALEVAQHLHHKRGYTPDIIVAHSGWGPGLFLKDIWGDAKYVGYFEWYYQGRADDITFLNGTHRAPLENAQERMRNAPIVTDLISCDLGLVPTQYQAKQFPTIFQEKLRVMHDGIDTDLFAPTDPGEVRLGEDVFTKEDEIVTYVARGMEPYRGFPEFMRALAAIQKRRPHLRAIIVGEDRSVYGRALPSGTSYKQEALEKSDLDLSRITFTGLVPRATYRKILQISSVHVYFTVPFVLSWSLLEAMSTECLILGSNTAPVKEVVTHEKNGLLTDYRHHERVVDDLDYALSLKNNATHLRAAARETILSRYAAKDLYPAKKALFAHLELT